MLPSGKHTKNYGKSPFLMGKLTISMAIFNSYVKLPEGKPHKNIPKNVKPRKKHQIKGVVHLTAVDCFGRHCSTDIEHPRGTCSADCSFNRVFYRLKMLKVDLRKHEKHV